jgi:predicted small secreted protein
MSMRVRSLAVALAAAGAVLAVASTAEAQCNTVRGRGTDSTLDGAKFQAYEILLQQTSLVSWASWMASGAKVGVAPGYTVKGLKFRCKPGGSGQECLSEATFCTKA